MQIKKFEVLGLFGTDNVSIPFDDDNIKILVGENGLGKTQILNLFYYTLTTDFFRLNEFNFSKLKLYFSNDKSIEIPKSQIRELVEIIYENPFVKDLIDEIGYSQFEMLRNKFRYDSNNFSNYLNKVILSSKSKYLRYKELKRIFEDSDRLFNPFFDERKKIIKNELQKTEILYFPTYRRIEKELYNQEYVEDDFNMNEENTLIRFGMDDVKRRFNFVQNKINKHLKEGLAQFTKDILIVVIDNEQASESLNDIYQKINESDIDIILSRVGDLLPNVQKDAVKNIVANKEIKNRLSLHLLQKLVDIYEKQKEQDQSVKLFRDICNKYLIDKKVFYDESNIKIDIKSDRTHEELDLKYLSSGEKQIISMFSKVYLSDSDKRFIVLFDEPELSLSMLWQKQLLPDILNSKKCDLLLAVTHSPFIFDNELDKYAVGLNEYIKPLN
jgi:predicted ATP-binding protein involved in virulence